MPIFGKYGLGLKTLVERVKTAAQTVNARLPKTVSDEQVEIIVQRIMRANEAFVAGQLTPEQFKAQMQTNVGHALHDIQDILGVASFLKLFRMPPDVAVAALFHRP